MKGKRWFLVGLVILSISIMEISCKEETDDKTNPPGPDPRRTFLIEYDCQISSNILSPSWRIDRSQHAFDPAITDLNIFHSDEFLLDTLVSWNDKGIYMSWYWTMNPYPDLRLAYKSYTNSVCSLSNIPEEPGELTLGWSSGNGIEGEAMGMVLTGRIKSLYLPSDSMEIKTLLHEWGHMRADLHHLCLGGGGMDFDNHDQQDCLMAQGQLAQCTGQWVDRNMHFCGKCLEKLKKVTW